MHLLVSSPHELIGHRCNHCRPPTVTLLIPSSLVWHHPHGRCVCHGIPDDRKLQLGDIINIDVTVYLNGHHGDCSAMFFVGTALVLVGHGFTPLTTPSPAVAIASHHSFRVVASRVVCREVRRGEASPSPAGCMGPSLAGERGAGELQLAADTC